MIRLRIVDGDLLTSACAAIMLPIDGALPPNADTAQVERSLGRIARALHRRFPECDLVEGIEGQVTFPVALGRAVHVELAKGPFRFALLLSMLPHQAEQTQSDRVRAAAHSAFVQALGMCDSLGVESVATPLLKGGWRMTSAQAMAMMLGAIGGASLRHALAVEIRILDEPSATTQMRELARSVGIDVQA